MDMTASDYVTMLIELLPPGPAWPKEDSQTSRLMAGWAQEIGRCDARALRLLEEADPRTTVELLTDWERVVGTPGVCEETGVSLTVVQRRALVVAKLIAQGGQSRQYFIDLAAALGYEITITEFFPFTVGMEIGLPMTGDAIAYAWQVEGPEFARTYLSCGDEVGDPLSVWENSLLQCVFNRLKPAHTQVIFQFAG